MNMQDPISDMIIRIRNGQSAKFTYVSMQFSKIKKGIAHILREEGYIEQYEIIDNNFILKIKLKYFSGKPVIEIIKRVSRPGLRIYKRKQELPKIMNGLGIAILSTSKGIITDKSARQKGIGGEILCYVA
ncbi:MAG: 30S ribosomal protein S8 [Candidatus Dasytiphilus stammeri]